LTQIFPPGPPVPAEFRADFDARKAALEVSLGLLVRKTPVTTDD
jgi:hypothetical protein